MRRLFNWIFGPRCQCCKGRGAVRQRQNTAYVDDRLNWVTLCEPCAEENAEHWADMWADYYSGLL